MHSEDESVLLQGQALVMLCTVFSRFCLSKIEGQEKYPELKLFWLVFPGETFWYCGLGFRQYKFSL